MKRAGRTPSWVAPARLGLAVAFAVWTVWAIRDADHLRPTGMLLYGVVAAMLLAGAIGLQRLHPEPKIPAAKAGPPGDDPRWKASSTPQLAGATCVECGEKIVMQPSGCACSDCTGPVHRKVCLARHQARAHRADAESAYR